MPQLSLKISKNIDMTQVDFHRLFAAIHDVLRDVPNMDIATCHSGVIQEDFSFIALGDDRLTKMYLELYWLLGQRAVGSEKTVGSKADENTGGYHCSANRKTRPDSVYPEAGLPILG